MHSLYQEYAQLTVQRLAILALSRPAQYPVYNRRSKEYLFSQYSLELQIHVMDLACLFGRAWGTLFRISSWRDLALLIHRNQIRTRTHWVEAVSPSDTHLCLLRKKEQLVIPQAFGQQFLHSKSKTLTTPLQ